MLTRRLVPVGLLLSGVYAAIVFTPGSVSAQDCLECHQEPISHCTVCQGSAATLAAGQPASQAAEAECEFCFRCVWGGWASFCQETYDCFWDLGWHCGGRCQAGGICTALSPCNATAQISTGTLSPPAGGIIVLTVTPLLYASSVQPRPGAAANTPTTQERR